MRQLLSFILQSVDPQHFRHLPTHVHPKVSLPPQSLIRRSKILRRTNAFFQPAAPFQKLGNIDYFKLWHLSSLPRASITPVEFPSPLATFKYSVRYHNLVFSATNTISMTRFRIKGRGILSGSMYYWQILGLCLSNFSRGILSNLLRILQFCI